MNPIIFDIETTTLDPATGEIIEIACVVEHNKYLTFKVKPTHIETADPEALRINGYSEEEWKNAWTLESVLKSLAMFVPERSYFMSYNVTFDWGFMQEAYRKTGIKNPFHYHRLDILSIAWAKLPKGSFLSLKSVCKYLEIPEEPSVHRALNGAITAFKVYQKLK